MYAGIAFSTQNTSEKPKPPRRKELSKWKVLYSVACYLFISAARQSSIKYSQHQRRNIKRGCFQSGGLNSWACRFLICRGVAWILVGSDFRLPFQRGYLLGLHCPGFANLFQRVQVIRAPRILVFNASATSNACRWIFRICASRKHDKNED